MQGNSNYKPYPEDENENNQEETKAEEKNFTDDEGTWLSWQALMDDVKDIDEEGDKDN